MFIIGLHTINQIRNQVCSALFLHLNLRLSGANLFLKGDCFILRSLKRKYSQYNNGNYCRSYNQNGLPMFHDQTSLI